MANTLSTYDDFQVIWQQSGLTDHFEKIMRLNMGNYKSCNLVWY